ncbi:MAG: 2OG-Fe(II) oxygenase [Nannocystaceae bacterium]
MLDDHALSRITDDLIARRYSVQRGLAPADLCADLRARAQERERRGELRQAGIGRADEHRIALGVRGDRIAWLDPDAPAEGRYLAALDDLGAHLNRALYLGIRDREAHFASFGPGSYYRRHLDRFRRHGARVVSTVLYLNERWPAGGGGELRIYDSEACETIAADVAPEAGTFVCFLSDEVWHEVLPTARPRLSVAAWLRQASVFG